MKIKALFIVTLFFLVPMSVLCAEAIEGNIEPLPVLQLTIPDSQHYRSYLGLEGASGDKFTLSDIVADILVIELFSMYCPHCQREAPMVNELYEKMEEVRAAGIVVKIIGLGASNSQFEVEHFRDTFNIPFPLFPDMDMTMYKILKGAGTPGFIGVRLKGGGGAAIVLRHTGGFDSSEDFLTEMIKKGGLL